MSQRGACCQEGPVAGCPTSQPALSCPAPEAFLGDETIERGISTVELGGCAGSATGSVALRRNRIMNAKLLPNGRLP